MKATAWTFALLIIIAVLFVFTPAKGLLGYSDRTLRYKITLTVDTPEGEKSASAVREAREFREPHIVNDAGGITYTIKKGEAVVLDLGARGVAFLLLGQEGEANLVFKRLAEHRAREVVTLQLAEYPLMVYFHDPADPKTVKALLQIKPCGTETQAQYKARCVVKDRFAEAFGAGVALKSVTVEMTDEPVTVDAVKSYLPHFQRNSPMIIKSGDDVLEAFPSDFIKG